MNKRTTMHRLQELVRLLRMGTRKHEAARLLSMSPNTERKYREAFEKAGILDDNLKELPTLEELRKIVGAATLPTQQISSVEDWRKTIEKKQKNGAGPQAIFDFLQLKGDFEGSLSSVKRMCIQLKRERGIQESDVSIPVETLPGEVGQVDFGYIGMRFDPVTKRMRKAYIFNMVLSFSRHMFSKIVFDQKIATWLQLHKDAFDFFGGVPRVVVPDNLKSAVIKAAFGRKECVLNESYRELARHFGFKIDPTPPRTPQQKGKVESSINYTKRNFMSTLDDDADVVESNKQLKFWTLNVAGMRIHGTTGKRPLKVFEEIEKKEMLPLPEGIYEPVVWAEPTLGRDCRFSFEGALYSAPWRLVGQKLKVRATSTELMVFHDDERVATHARVEAGCFCILDAHLPPKRRDFRHRAPEYWYERAARIAPEVEVWSREVMASDDVLLKIGVLQTSIPYLEQEVSKERAAKVCRRASFYGAFKFTAIKRIVKRGLDKQPLPVDVVLPDDSDVLNNPRFARDILEFLELPQEENHDPH